MIKIKIGLAMYVSFFAGYVTLENFRNVSQERLSNAITV